MKSLEDRINTLCIKCEYFNYKYYVNDNCLDCIMRWRRWRRGNGKRQI